jgi:5,10-methylenetetrahydromethanopterin reductase
MSEAVRQTTPEISEALTVAGTPEECAERIRTDLVEAGIEDILLALVDPAVVAGYTGERPEDLPETRQQLRLICDRLVPVLDGAR